MIEKFKVDQKEMLTTVMQKIDDNANGMVFIVDEKDELCGVVSDGDIRRWILRGGSLETPITEVMNRDPKYVLDNNIDKAEFYFHKMKIRVVPILDSSRHIIDIILSNDKKIVEKTAKQILKNVAVIIMAGGKGTRLHPYTKILPKPLIPIDEIPIVERVMDAFNEYGINNFLMTVNYKKNMILSYFSEIEKPYNIDYIEEDKPLGTAGSIKLIDGDIKNPLFVANCDSLIRTNYSDLYRHHMNMGNAITLVAALKNDTIPYGVVYSKENGILERMDEKPTRSYLINTGMYIINPEIIGLIPENTFFHMTHLVDKAMKNGYQVGVYPVSEDSFLDMGEFAEMKRMEEKLKVHIEGIE